MTSVGHSLTGLTVAVLFAPKLSGFGDKLRRYALFLFCALIPDIEVHGWGHHRYHVSHSIIVIGVLLALILALAASVQAVRKKGVPWRIFLGCSTAWMSHIFLDSLYNHGKGIKVMWPLSEWRLNFALPWFSTLPPYPVSLVHVKICLIELAFYAPILTAAIVIRRMIQKRGELSGGTI